MIWTLTKSAVNQCLDDCSQYFCLGSSSPMKWGVEDTYLHLSLLSLEPLSMHYQLIVQPYPRVWCHDFIQSFIKFQEENQFYQFLYFHQFSGQSRFSTQREETMNFAIVFCSFLPVNMSRFQSITVAHGTTWFWKCFNGNLKVFRTWMVFELYPQLKIQTLQWFQIDETGSILAVCFLKNTA